MYNPLVLRLTPGYIPSTYGQCKWHNSTDMLTYLRAGIPFMWAGFAIGTGKPLKMKERMLTVSNRRKLWSAPEQFEGSCQWAPIFSSQILHSLLHSHVQGKSWSFWVSLLKPCIHTKPISDSRPFVYLALKQCLNSFQSLVPSHSYKEYPMHCHCFADESSESQRCWDLPREMNWDKSYPRLELRFSDILVHACFVILFSLVWVHFTRQLC